MRMDKKKKKISKPLAVVLIIVIFFSLSFSVRQYLRIQRFNIISSYRQEISSKIVQNHGTLNQNNVNLISSWMTFDYINRVFDLPADYLKNSLNISDIQYPRIPISKYVKNHNLDANQFVTQVKNTVTDYFTNH